MSTPSSTPPPSPLLDALSRAAVVSKFLAAALVASASVRFAVAAFQHTLGTAPPSGARVASADAPQHAAPLVRQTTPPVPVASAQKVVAVGRPRSIQLGISPPGRMDIYVNGRLLGHTPFVGDTSCKTGMPLKIELVPPSGPPLIYDRECRGSMIEITGPPP
jgi:hypothetical protein